MNRVANWGVVLALLMSFPMLAHAQSAETVASLSRLDGRVQVIQGESGQSLQGKNGLLLRAGDTVVTKDETRVTIKFRDGSEVRMFPNSRFLVQGIKESDSKTRSFSYKLFLKLGSIWGKFVPQRQIANIEMPTATIGIKGTTLRATVRDGKGRIALTEGKIEVTNDRGKVDLEPGKMITDFTRSDDLTKKIIDIPYKIEIRSEKQNLKFPGNQSEEVFVTLQLIDIKTGAEKHRPGKVYFRSNYNRIAYPPKADLNQRGFVRVPLVISSPEMSDEKLDGNIFVWALIDNEKGDDTAEGRILFTIPTKGGKQRIRIEADSGEGKQVR